MFDTEKSIVEVEKRPALYDQSLKDYANRDQKTKLWNEIGNEVYENWNELSDEERNKIGKELQTKWKSIRDHFKKEVALETKLKSGQAAKSKKKYIYYDQLLFLRTHITNRQTSSNFKEQDLDENAEHNPGNSPEQEAGSSEPNTKKRARKRKEISQSSEIKEITDILSESVALQKQDKAGDRMGNKAFLMSLLPLMDNIPQNQLIAIRCKIMEVFQIFSSTQNMPSYAAQHQSHTSYSSSFSNNVWEAPYPATYNYSQPQTSRQSIFTTQPPSVIAAPTPSPGQYLASPSTNSEETQMSESTKWNKIAI